MPKKTKLEKGSVVKASHPNSKWLTHGKKYTIEWLSMKEKYIAVRNDDGKIKPYAKGNFELNQPKEKPQQIEVGEWLYKGCFIQKSEHPQLVGKYEVFKNNEDQDYVGRCWTFGEAKKLCEENECFDNTLSFDLGINF